MCSETLVSGHNVDYLQFLRRKGALVPAKHDAALTCEFRELVEWTFPVHMNDPVWIDRLYDVWISYGAFSPDSFNYNAKGANARFDVRVDQKQTDGIGLRRIVPRPAFVYWFVECMKDKGHADGAPVVGYKAYFLLCFKLNVDYRQRQRFKRSQRGKGK